MAIERVRAYFEEQSMADRILEFDVSSATVDLAAQAVGCQPERIAKTLSFMIDSKCVLIVTAGDTRVNNSKFKSQFGTKAKMLSSNEVAALTGHDVGGCCPFAVREGVAIYLDISLKRFQTVFPACGSANSAIELSIAELEEHAHAHSWVDVCKGWGGE